MWINGIIVIIHWIFIFYCRIKVEFQVWPLQVTIPKKNMSPQLRLSLETGLLLSDRLRRQLIQVLFDYMWQFGRLVFKSFSSSRLPYNCRGNLFLVGKWQLGYSVFPVTLDLIPSWWHSLLAEEREVLVRNVLLYHAIFEHFGMNHFFSNHLQEYDFPSYSKIENREIKSFCVYWTVINALGNLESMQTLYFFAHNTMFYFRVLYVPDLASSLFPEPITEYYLL